MHPIDPGPSHRRKPKFTYKSPIGGSDWNLLSSCATTVGNEKMSSISKQSMMSPLENLISKDIRKVKRKRTAYRLLPLYHPQGSLALSLPPLDPTSFGLQNEIMSDEGGRRSSVRARRPAAKLRESEEEHPSTVLTPHVEPETVTQEVREKPSPRKRRSGANSMKRKRKEVDDGDATYPAKRTRFPRGATNHAQEDDEVMESVHPFVDTVLSPEPEPEASDEKLTEATEQISSVESSEPQDRRAIATKHVSDLLPVLPTITEIDKTQRVFMKDNREFDNKIVTSNPVVEEKEEGEISEEGHALI